MLSVWGLPAHNSFLKILTVTAVLAAAETASFYHTLQRAIPSAALEGCVEEILIPLLFPAALGVVFFILIRAERMADSEAGYTMMRLKRPLSIVYIQGNPEPIKPLALQYTEK